MPRRSTSSTKTKRTSPTSQVPQTQQSQVPMQQQPKQPGLFAQMASTAAGVAVGSTIGHTLGHGNEYLIVGITSMFGGSSQPQQQQPVQQQQYSQPQTVCEPDQKAFMKCLETHSNDITACQFYLDMLKQCQSDSKLQ